MADTSLVLGGMLLRERGRGTGLPKYSQPAGTADKVTIQPVQIYVEYMLCDLSRTGTEDRAIRDPGTNPFKCKRATDTCNILAGWLKAQSLTGLRHLGLESVGGRTAFIAGRAKEQVLYPRFPSD